MTEAAQFEECACSLVQMVTNALRRGASVRQDCTFIQYYAARPRANWHALARSGRRQHDVIVLYSG